MDKNTPKLTVTNKRIIEFYNNNPNLEFETMNIMLIDILDKLLKTMDTTTLNNTIASQILTTMHELKTSVSNVNNHVSSFQTTMSAEFVMRLNEMRRDYMEGVRTIISAHSTDNVYPFISTQMNQLVDTMRKSVVDTCPQIQETVKCVCESMLVDVKKMGENTLDVNVLDAFVERNNVKFSELLNTSITTNNSNIASSENRITTKLTSIHDASVSAGNVQTDLKNGVADLLHKMNNSSVKGKLSENILSNIVHTLYPTAEIDSVGAQKETGDIILKRNDKPNILVENKNYGKNVGQEEVKKFIRDVEIQDCCGLFLSQNFGIANKCNYEINLHNDNVLVYVHDVNNDPEKIKIAIDIIDHFKAKIDELRSMGDGDTEIDQIPKDTLTEINREYQQFVINKLTHVRCIKEMSQKLLKQTDELKFPTLDLYLSTRYAFSSSKFICEYCGFPGKNQPAISAHQRSCKKKREMEAPSE